MTTKSLFPPNIAKDLLFEIHSVRSRGSLEFIENFVMQCKFTIAA